MKYYPRIALRSSLPKNRTQHTLSCMPSFKMLKVNLIVHSKIIERVLETMLLIRIIGFFLITLALLLMLLEISFLFTGHSLLQPLGQIWFEINSNGLNLAQAITQRYISVWVWDYIFVPLLNMPAWKSLTAVVLIFFVIGRLLSKVVKQKRSFR